MYTEKTFSSNLPDRQKTQLASLSKILRESNSSDSKFYEFEAAVVIDVIYNEDHKIFKNFPPTIDITNFPGTPSDSDVDYTWIGRALVRMVNSERGKDRDTLSWAIPLNNYQELPLKNEIVYVVKYFEQFYYSKLNVRNFVNNNADFRYEKKYGLNDGLGSDGVVSHTRNPEIPDPTKDFVGSLGSYFKNNDRIRAVRRNEGDTVIESRFGQSIRFSGFSGNSETDSGVGYGSYPFGTGNPCIFIRNRQRDLSSSQVEKNVGGTIREDVNLDGTSIQITSGKYVSQWDLETISIKPFEVGKYSSTFAPVGSTTFTFPKLDGDQCMIQSDRILISAKKKEMLLCSKYRMSLFTDDEFSVNSKFQIVLTTLQHFHINSPYIFLGDYGAAEQPIVLGTEFSRWAFDLINWLKIHTHIYKHTHSKSSGPSPEKTQVTPEIQELIRLQSLIPELVSDRVFTSNRRKGTGTEISQINNPPQTISKIPKG